MNTSTKLPFDLVPLDQTTCQQVFFDGFSGVLLSKAISKITFHHVVGVTTEGREQRKPMLTMAIPTSVLIELCEKFLSDAKEYDLVADAERQPKKKGAGLRATKRQLV